MDGYSSWNETNMAFQDVHFMLFIYFIFKFAASETDQNDPFCKHFFQCCSSTMQHHRSLF